MPQTGSMVMRRNVSAAVAPGASRAAPPRRRRGAAADRAYVAPAEPGRPGPGRGRAALPDLDLVAGLGVVDEEAAAGRHVREQAPVGRPGRVEVRALALRHAVDPAGLQVEDEDVEHAALVAAGERDLRLVGARAEARRLVVLALEGDALGAAAATPTSRRSAASPAGSTRTRSASRRARTTASCRWRGCW